MPGKQVKRWDVYEACRKDKSNSKTKCAKIANSAARKGGGGKKK